MHGDLSKACSRLQRFRHDDAGAVTVDWVVLTASIVGLAIWLFSVITEQHFRDAAVKINADITMAIQR